MEKTYSSFSIYSRFARNMPQSAIFGFLLADKDTFQIKNLILLLFKIYLCESRSSKALIFDSFLRKTEKKLCYEKKLFH